MIKLNMQIKTRQKKQINKIVFKRIKSGLNKTKIKEFANIALKPSLFSK